MNTVHNTLLIFYVCQTLYVLQPTLSNKACYLVADMYCKLWSLVSSGRKHSSWMCGAQMSQEKISLDQSVYFIF